MNLLPKETYRNISDISLEYLINDIKIKGLIFDFDGTLKRNKKIDKGTFKFIDEAKEKGLKVAVISNNFYVNNDDLKDLEIFVVKKFAFKPLKKPFLNMAEKMRLNPTEIAFIGNNRISDIWGANRCKMFSIYIQDINKFWFKRGIKERLKDLGIKHVE